jgi:hypothetical protein
MFWVVRTKDRADPSPAVRRAVSGLDPDVAVASTSMEEYIARVMASRRFVLRILVAFAMTALGLAACGLYALVSSSALTKNRPAVFG